MGRREYKWPLALPSVEDMHRLRREVDDVAPAVLGAGRRQNRKPLVHIKLVPGHLRDFFAALTCKRQEFDDVPEGATNLPGTAQNLS